MISSLIRLQRIIICLLCHITYMKIWQLCADDKNNGTFSDYHRYLSSNSEQCDDTSGFKRYFDSMDEIYGINEKQIGTCLPVHKQCGWPPISKSNRLSAEQKKLPLLVLSVGLEGAGHHLWTEILNSPIFDCVWINARHYHRDIDHGVPRTTVDKLMDGFKEMIKNRIDSGKSPCKTIYDAEDSFPTGAIRKAGIQTANNLF